MTTRSGASYKQKEPNMAEGEAVVAEMAKMLKALIIDRQQQEKELEAERKRWDEELAEQLHNCAVETGTWEAALREERRKRDEELAIWETESRMQMELVKSLVEGVKKQGDVAVRKAEEEKMSRSWNWPRKMT